MSLAVFATPTVTAECLALTLTLPRRGMVPAHVELSADVAPAVGEVVTIILASENGAAPQSFTGIVRRRGLWAGRVRVVVPLGAGGLRDTLQSRDHVGGLFPVTALLVAQGIVDAAGETLAESSKALLQTITLPRWTRAGADAIGNGGTAIEALDMLVSRLSLLTSKPTMTWRMLPDATIWIGEDTYADGGDTGNVFYDDDDDGRVDCAPPAASLRPGTTVNGRRAERITYRIDGDALRAEVLYDIAGELTANETPDVYRETHAATVALQHADGTVDLNPDDPRLAGNGLRSVPFRCGIPGARVVIPVGSRLRMAFADTDPTQPFAFALDQDPTASKAIHRVGDNGVGGAFSAVGVAPGAPIMFVYTPPGAVPLPPSASVLVVTEATTGSSEIFVR